MVGIVHPNSYTGGNSGLSGVYRLNGDKTDSGTDYKWAAGATTQEMRDYLYYCTNVDERQYFVYPRVDVMDGSEPSLQELLNGVPALENGKASQVKAYEDRLHIRGEFKEI